MSSEFNKLTQAQQDAVRRVIKRARRWDAFYSESIPIGVYVYAYRGHEALIPGGWVHWGVNGPDGVNIARGVIAKGEDL